MNKMGKLTLEIKDHLVNLGFVITGFSDEYYYIYAEYENRYYRFNITAMTMDICDGDFDRWANSIGNTEDIPKKLSKLQESLNRLKDRSVVY